jgi:phosphoserine phosphatase
MPPKPDAPPASQVPLVVDLDGTLIRTDLLWEHLARLLRRNPLQFFQILFWWTRGRAFLKKQLVRRVTIDPATLPYHEKFLAFLRGQKSAGRRLVLATASDLQMALPVANYVGLFDEVLGSDGKTNLRSENKLKTLTEKFGARGFDYAGNSSADYAVWRGAREAIVVNANQAVLKQAAQCTKPGPAFCDGYSPFAIFKSVLNELFLRSGYLPAAGAGFLLAAAFPKTGIAGFAWVAPALLIFAAQGKEFRRCVSRWLRWRNFLLAGVALLAAADSGRGLSDSRLVRLERVHVGLFWDLDVAARRKNRGGQLGAAKSLVARGRGSVGWIGNFSRTFSRRLSVEPAWHVAIPAYAADPDRIGHGRLRRFIPRRLGFAGDVLGGARGFLQTRFTLRMAAGCVPAAAGRGAVVRGRLLPDADAPNTGENQQTLRITLIQPSVPQNLIWDPNANSNRFQQLLTLSENALTNKTDLLIWPEAALPEFDDASYAAITNLVRTHHLWMIFNADDRPTENSGDFNAAFLFDPDGNSREFITSANSSSSANTFRSCAGCRS